MKFLPILLISGLMAMTALGSPLNRRQNDVQPCEDGEGDVLNKAWDGNASTNSCEFSRSSI